MRKLCILISVVLLLSGCQSQKKSDEADDYILFATPLRQHPIWLQAKEGFDAACDDYGIRCDWLGSSIIDTNKMEEVIETGILQGADGIITQGVISEDVIRKAHDKKIPVILVDSDMPDSERMAFMGKDFHKQAEILLEDIERNYGYDKHLNIAVQVAEHSFAIAKDQIRQIEEVFLNHPGGYTIVSISESKSDKVRAKREWDQVLSEHDEINIGINFAAESSEFCYELAMELGIRDEMLIYGVDNTADNLNLVREGAVNGIVVIDFYDYGYEAVKLLYDYKKKEATPQDPLIPMDLVIINQDNITAFEKEIKHGTKEER